MEEQDKKLQSEEQIADEKLEEVTGGKKESVNDTPEEGAGEKGFFKFKKKKFFHHHY